MSLRVLRRNAVSLCRRFVARQTIKPVLRSTASRWLSHSPVVYTENVSRQCTFALRATSAPCTMIRSIGFLMRNSFSTDTTMQSQKRAPAVAQNELVVQAPIPRIRLPRVVIVGRPNVGKSTLFNRLIQGSHKAIVHAASGVTRDRKEGPAELGDVHFMLTDTAGLDEIVDTLKLKDQVDKDVPKRRGKNDSDATFSYDGNFLSAELQKSILGQTEQAVNEADLIIFLIDAREGLTPADQHFARWLRQRLKSGLGTKVMCVANKCEVESTKHEAGYHEAYRLGLGDPIPLSAQTRAGFIELRQEILKAFEKLPPDVQFTAEAAAAVHAAKAAAEANESLVRLAVVGRPNAGKSTLINAVIGTNRLVTGPQAGVTRDSINVRWRDPRFEKEEFELVDTAGLKGVTATSLGRYSRVDSLAMAASLRSIELANVVALVVDCFTGVPMTAPLKPLPPNILKPDAKHGPELNTALLLADKVFTAADQAIAARAVTEGRALLFIANKWDLIPSLYQQYLNVGLRLTLDRTLASASGIPIIPVSALTNHNTQTILPIALQQFSRWKKRLTTHNLNRWLQAVVAYQQPPQGAHPITLRYITQVMAKPPSFRLFGSRTHLLPQHYVNFLLNSLRKEFDFQGIPLRLQVLGRGKSADDREWHPGNQEQDKKKHKSKGTKKAATTKKK